MTLDALLQIVTDDSVNTGVSTTETSTAFDFGTALGALGDLQGFPEGATFVVVPSNAPESGALPVTLDLELSIDGTNYRRICTVTYTNATKEIKSARFGLLDWVPDAAVLSGTDRAAAANLKARVVITYVNSAGTFIYSAFIAGTQHTGPFVE